MNRSKPEDTAVPSPRPRLSGGRGRGYRFRRLGVAGVLATLAAAGCTGSRRAGVNVPPGIADDPRFAAGDAGAIARARADSLRYPYTQADVDFMTGMIHHHAQAITISRWAPSHGASAELQRLTARIINAQEGEIRQMQDWLRDRNRMPPAVDSLGNVTMPSAGGAAMAGHDMSAHAGHAMGGSMGVTSMPGMLSAVQLAELDAARGEEFDRLFLIGMIRHHQGAVRMVRELLANDGAGQDETIFKFANDVEVDQGTEIQRMLTMLLERGHVLPPS